MQSIRGSRGRTSPLYDGKPRYLEAAGRGGTSVWGESISMADEIPWQICRVLTLPSSKSAMGSDPQFGISSHSLSF